MLKAGDMSRPAPEIRLSTEEKETLLRWMRSSKAEQRMVQRARVILLAASGLNGKQIALKMQTRAARVSKWLRRFARDRIAALNDSPRSGEKRRKYTSATEERILKALDEPPPAGYSRWNGRLLAQHLGEVSQCAPPRFFVGTGQVQRRIISWELARGVRRNLTRGQL